MNPIRIVFTHYGIGDRDGVNAIMFRNLAGLNDLKRPYQITLAGKLAPNIKEFEDVYHRRFSVLDIPEFTPGFWDRHVEDCSVQDYVEIGMKLFEIIKEKFAAFDVVVVENLQVGNFPPLVYAFYMYTRWCYEHKSDKRFIFRAHDFFWHRPENLANVVKFNATLNPAVPDWHTMFFPNIPNVYFLAINTSAMHFIIEHGIPEDHLTFVPNCIDNTLEEAGEDSIGFRKQLEEEWGLAPDEEIIFSPIRCTPRKNVEESLLLLQVLNRLAEDHPGIPGNLRHELKFHLILSMNVDSGKAMRYSAAIEAFIEMNRIPAHIGFKGMINLERELDKDGSVKTYSLSDAYAVSRAVLSTSTLEGFGFVFIEPWFTGKPLIGRDIPDVTYDFKLEGGLRFRHLYEKLTIENIDFPDIGAKHPYIEHGGNIMHPEKLETKLEIVRKISDNEFFLSFINENQAALVPIVRLLRNPELSQRMIRRNQGQVNAFYTQEAAARKLDKIITDILASE